MRVIASVVVVLALAGCTGRSAAHEHTQFDATATTDLDSIQRGDCAAVAVRFDRQMSSLSSAQLCAAYKTYEEQFGSLQKQGAGYSTKRGGLAVVRVPLTLQKSKGEFRETFRSDGKIAGLYLLRPGVPLP